MCGASITIPGVIQLVIYTSEPDAEQKDGIQETYSIPTLLPPH